MARIVSARPCQIHDVLGQTASPVKIPDYQRSYSWTLEEIDVFWRDILAFQSRYPGVLIDSKYYFLGSVVGIEVDTPKSLVLLDGQQRLATTVIALSAIRDALKNIQLETATDASRDLQSHYIAYKPTIRGEVQYSLTLNRYDRPYFQSLIQDLPVSERRPEYASHKAIKVAQEFFAARLSELLQTTEQEEAKVDLLNRLRETITHHLSLVVVLTNNEEDATEIFETLNDRGRDLTTLDLLRNFLLGQCENDQQREEVIRSWTEVLELSDVTARAQTFLRHFWIVRHGDVKSRGLYKEIKHVLLDSFQNNPGPSSVKFSIELSTSADLYRQLIDAQTGTAELDELLSDMKTLEASSLYPLVLAIAEKENFAAAATMAKAVIAAYVRWNVIGKRESTHFEELVFDLSKKIFADEITAQSAITRLRSSSLSDEEFEQAFSTASLLKSSHRKYILRTLENYFRKRERADDVITAVANVEHIYPQKPTTDLRLEDHDDWVNRHGNLTILHRSLNASARNAGFPVKKTILRAVSDVHHQSTRCFPILE